MRIFFRLMAALAIFTATLTAPAMAAETASAKMKQVLPYLEKYFETPESDRTLIRLVYRIKSRSLPESDIRAWYTLDGKRVDLKLNDRGELIEYPDMATYMRNPTVETNLSRKDIVLALRVRPDLPLSTSYSASTLNESLAQADKGARRLMGMFGFLKAKAKGFKFEVKTGTTAEMVMANGDVRPIAITWVNPAVSHVDIDRSTLAGAKSVRFSEAPLITMYLD